jgi:hypothetical protein
LHTQQLRRDKESAGVKESDLPQISCKREALLGLPLSAYQRYADAIEDGFVEAAEFLNELKIILAKDVPYPPQIVALATTFSILDQQSQNLPAREKLARWFWSIALGEQYGSSTEFKLARDIPELVAWISAEGPTPRSIDDAIFQQERLRSLRFRLSAANKAIHALLMKQGCQDFISGKPFELMTFYDLKVDIHHIFPRAWCKKKGIDRKVYDAIINKSPLSKKSNNMIGGSAPSVYLRRIEDEQGISPSRLDEILRTHLIEPELLRSDDFEGFYAARKKALSNLIGSAIGKPVVEKAGSNEVETEIDEEPSDEVELSEIDEDIAA